MTGMQYSQLSHVPSFAENLFTFPGVNNYFCLFICLGCNVLILPRCINPKCIPHCNHVSIQPMPLIFFRLTHFLKKIFPELLTVSSQTWVLTQEPFYLPG